MSDEETKPYIVRRCGWRSGWRWRIYRIAEDGDYLIPTHPSLQFWRWITAARFGTCLAEAYRMGKYWSTEA